MKLSRNAFIYVAILLLGFAIAYQIRQHYHAELAADRQHYILEEQDKAKLLADQIERQFDDVYRQLRTIARLPGVRSILPHAVNLDQNADKTVQEIYNNIASSFDVSEVYIVQSDLDPDSLDPQSGKPQEPMKMYDQLIVDRNATVNFDAGERSELPEEEIYEYRKLKEQLSYLISEFGHETKFKLLDYPAISSSEVITCDNRLLHPGKIDDRDRSGIIYSVPFYSDEGNLKGVVSAIFLTQVLRNILPSDDYVLINVKQGLFITKNKDLPNQDQALQKEVNPDPTKIYSESIPLNIKDLGGQWVLRVSVSDDKFWTRADVEDDSSEMHNSFVILTVFIILLLFSISLWFRYKKNLEDNNIVLEKTVRERTKELELKRLLAEDLAVVAQQAAKAKSDFLANMSHEIRTPMNAILGYSEILSSMNMDEKQKIFLKNISSSGQLLLNIINDILDFSKLESGKIKLESIDFSLDHLVSETFKMISPRLREKNLDSVLNIAADVPLAVKGDPTRLKQVIINLLSNAIKFTQKGTLSIEVTLVSAQPEALRIKFCVSDTGIGISPENVQKLFRPFTQADESTTRKFGGTGLGLMICKSLVEAMKGRIWIESTENVGSRVYFEIELKPGQPIVDRLIQPLSAESIKDKSVFILDDNALTRDIIEIYAREIGLTLKGTSSNAHEAFDRISGMVKQGQKIDMIFSDVMMPGMDGYEFSRRIKADAALKAIKILAVTSDIRLGIVEQAEKHAFDGYLPKPFTRDDLLNVVATMLGDHRKETNLPPVTRHMAQELGCKGLRILVVDDVASNRELLKFFLDMLGCQSHYLCNGQEAVDHLRGNLKEYDMCLMDLQMPVLGGEEATKIIRSEISKDFPIIALTAAALSEDKQKALAAGMNDFLTKPFTQLSLRDALMKHKR